MLTEDDWKDLPDDAELAFLVLDDRLWAKVQKAREPDRISFFDERNNHDTTLAKQAEKVYVESVKGYIDEAQIDVDIWVNTRLIDDAWEEYFTQFRGKIEYYKTRLRTREKIAFMARPGEEVVLSEDFREEINYFLNRIRKIIHLSNIDLSKKYVGRRGISKQDQVRTF